MELMKLLATWRNRQIYRQSNRHTVASADEDKKTMIKVLRELKLFKSVPNSKTMIKVLGELKLFKSVPNSKHSNFHNISKSPFVMSMM